MQIVLKSGKSQSGGVSYTSTHYSNVTSLLLVKFKPYYLQFLSQHSHFIDIYLFFSDVDWIETWFYVSVMYSFDFYSFCYIYLLTLSHLLQFLPMQETLKYFFFSELVNYSHLLF